MIYIDKYAYISGFKNINPTVKIVFFILATITCISFNSTPFHLFLIAFMTAILTTKGKIPFLYFLKMLLIPAVFLIMSTLGIIVNISAAAPSYDFLKLGWLYLYITEAGLIQAGMLICKSMAAVSCLYFLILSTKMPDIIRFLYKIKTPLIVVSLLTLVYRFIFLLLEKTITKRNSQKCRYGYVTYKKGLKSFGMLFASVFVESYDKADKIYDAMISRGYDGTMRFLSQKN